MQYISNCLNIDCDHYWQGPESRRARVKTRDHSEETGHPVRLSGVYDGPSGAGVYVDGVRVEDMGKASRYLEEYRNEKALRHQRRG